MADAVKLQFVIQDLAEGKYGNVPPDIKNFLINRKQLVRNDDNAVALDKVNLITGTCGQLKTFTDSRSSALLYSNGPGSGKTLNAVRIGMSYAYFTNRKPFWFINVPEYIELNKRAMHSPEDMERLKYEESMIARSSIVIFDDIVRKDCTSYENDLLYRTINMCPKSRIYTSNLEPIAIRTALQGEVADRVLCCMQIKFPSTSWRAGNNNNNNNILNKEINNNGRYNNYTDPGNNNIFF